MTGGLERRQRRGVAAGLVDVAVGTDTAGSVRIPSAFCGSPATSPRGGVFRRPRLSLPRGAWTTVGPLAIALRMPASPRDHAGRPLEQNREIRRVGLVARLFERADPGSPRSARGCGHPGPGAEPVELPLHEEIATINAARDAPRRRRRYHKHWLRTNTPTTAQTSAPEPSPACSCPRPPCHRLRAGTGSRAVGARARDFDLLFAPAAQGVAPRLDAIPPTTGLGHALQLAPLAARAPGHERAVRVRRRPPVGLSLTGRPATTTSPCGPPRSSSGRPIGTCGARLTALPERSCIQPTRPNRRGRTLMSVRDQGRGAS